MRYFVVLQTNESDDLNIQNMKRENKLYSYKDQLAEIELKKEMAKKKGKIAQIRCKLAWVYINWVSVT